MSFLKGFTSVFDWMCPRTLDERLQDLYDDMGWGKYKNPNEEYNKMHNWDLIRDDQVRHMWECPDCDHVTYVGPEFYADKGTPHCDKCQCDYEYMGTEVDL